MAKALTGMPRTLTAFRSGQLNEWRTTLVVKETACLSVEDRAAVDEELAADTGTLDGAGDRAITAAVRAAAYWRDPRSVARRAARAVKGRTVSLRPAPDTMTYLTALLPVAQGVAAYAALSREADAARSGGDPRSRGQVMADTLVERLTGTPGGITGIDVHLVMTDRALFQGDSEPARIPGYGIIPAETARTLLLNPEHSGTEAHGRHALALWVRPALHNTRDRRTRGDGLQGPALPRRAQTLCSAPGRYLPHTVLRRAHPPPRPHHRLAQRRHHHREKWARPLRSLQPHQGNPRLVRDTVAAARPPAHRPGPDTHRAFLPPHRTTVTRHSEDGGVPGGNPVPDTSVSVTS